MATASAKSKSYEKARKTFDSLDMEERARFLLESTVSIVADGLEKVSTKLTSEMESVFDQCRDEEDADMDAAPAAKKSAPKKKSAAKKKTSSKKRGSSDK